MRRKHHQHCLKPWPCFHLWNFEQRRKVISATRFLRSLQRWINGSMCHARMVVNGKNVIDFNCMTVGSVIKVGGTATGREGGDR